MGRRGEFIIIIDLLVCEKKLSDDNRSDSVFLGCSVSARLFGDSSTSDATRQCSNKLGIALAAPSVVCE